MWAPAIPDNGLIRLAAETINKCMDNSTAVTVAVLMLAFLIMTFGFMKRDFGYGIFMMWVGIVSVLAIVAYHIIP